MKKVLYFLTILTVIFGAFIFVPEAKAAATKPFDWQLITQSPYPSTLAPGESTEVWIEVKNTGTVTWNRDGIINAVRLGSGSEYGSENQQKDYKSEFVFSPSLQECPYQAGGFCLSGQWLSDNRPAKILHPEVKPGWHTRFQFYITAPTTPGVYKAYFTPVVEGVEWMKDIGLYWQITVSESALNCVEEGGSLGAVVPDNGLQCCAGLAPYIPTGIVGSRGTCQVPGYGSSSNKTLTSITLSPNRAVSVKSGNVYDFVLIANYSDGSTETVTSLATWNVVYDTGTGTMMTTIPGRFIAGGIGTCTVTASYGGKSVTSGIITVTGL